MKRAGASEKEREQQDWLAELALEYPDEQWLRPQQADVIDFQHEPWHNLYFRAFDDLQYDRFFGAMGGEGPITYLALSQWARDHAVYGEDFHEFKIFMNAVDAEWLQMQRERSETEREDAKRREELA
ncbi:hypothetical protein GOZ97_07390 [Agrobacterium vitis]|uniref:hypothetical protein n=1 Tax=Agrobacterium vitis TaxID=373 RepID=UPI0008FAF1AC|nr:hypothetical protein [Agrobacterium vitis]MUZ53022.1 hypothetical protein [Agrobacterium vitis]MUZ91241.1 hypothetical protein [Agrobacterium vitis]MVA40315.1 hypothetical protein [Agrobacterium vitis]NSX96161.1 hypothetical protein [Agrobacterium vitis]OHZ30854.1 hypothetical protein BBL07_22580 [Agrobacterium vitis]